MNHIKLFDNPQFHDENYGFHFGRLNKIFAKKASKYLTLKEIRDVQLEITEDWVSTILPQDEFEKFTERYFRILFL